MFIRRAIGLLEAGEDSLSLARAHMVAGRMLNLDLRYDEAEAHLQRAERMYTLGGTPIDLGILRGEEARLAASNGDAETALAYATEAAELLNNDARYRSNVWHALAAAHAAAGNPQEAEKNYRLALKDLEGLRQWREASQVARELSQLLRSLDRQDEAYSVLDRASLLTVRHLGVAQGRLRDEAGEAKDDHV